MFLAPTKFSTVILLAPLLLSCTAIQRTNPNNLTLNSVELIRPGKTTRTQVEQVLGTPQKTFLYEKNGTKEITWLYFEQPFSALARASVTFREGTDTTSSVAWQVRPGENESNLDAVKARYKDIAFEKKQAEWINPHAGPDEVFFSDPEKGLEVTYSQSKKNVTSLVWTDAKNTLVTRAPNKSKPDLEFQISP